MDDVTQVEVTNCPACQSENTGWDCMSADATDTCTEWSPECYDCGFSILKNGMTKVEAMEFWTRLTTEAKQAAQIAALRERVAMLEGAIPKHLLAVMNRLQDEYAEPANQIAVDASAESGLAITEKYVREALKALSVLGWATRSVLVCDENKLRGSGYLLTTTGYNMREILPEPRRIDTALKDTTP